MALRLRGATSGYIELKAPASAGDNTLTLPVNNGSANQLLKTDGSGNLSWTDDNSGVSLSGSTNNTIATVTGANALQGEANLKFDGNKLDIDSAGQNVLQLNSTHSDGPNVTFERSGTGFGNVGSAAAITSGTATDFAVGATANLIFGSNGSNERMRIASDGKVGIGTSSPDSILHVHNGSAGSIAASSAANLTIESSASDYSVLQFLSPATAAQQIRFGDPADNGAGWFQYSHSNNAMTFGTAGPEKMRLDSNGRLLVGTTTEGFATYGDKFTIGDSGHCGMTIRSGTSSYGTIYFSDGDDGSADEVRGFLDYNHSTNIMQLGTDGGARISISPTGQFNFNYKTNTAPPSPTNGGNEGLQIYATREDNSNFLGTVDFVAGRGSDNTNGGTQMRFFVQDRVSGTNPAQVLRLNRTGVVQVMSERLTLGTSLTNGGANDGNFCIEFSSASRNAVKLRDTHNAGSTTYMVLVGGSATVGSITGTTGQASFNNLSDYRSKENDVEITDGITKLKLLRPIRFNYKTDSSTLCDGFFAHEVTPAVPSAVTGVKDAVDSEGKIDPQMLDASKLVPLITAALKEAIAKIETLETKVAALESA